MPDQGNFAGSDLILSIMVFNVDAQVLLKLHQAACRACTWTSGYVRPPAKLNKAGSHRHMVLGLIMNDNYSNQLHCG